MSGSVKPVRSSVGAAPVPLSPQLTIPEVAAILRERYPDDAATGYRRYAFAQLADAAAIRRLRDVGFGVSAIGALLAAYQFVYLTIVNVRVKRQLARVEQTEARLHAESLGMAEAEAA